MAMNETMCYLKLLQLTYFKMSAQIEMRTQLRFSIWNEAHDIVFEYTASLLATEMTKEWPKSKKLFENKC